MKRHLQYPWGVFAGSQLEQMADPVKNFWDAPSTPYQWKHTHVSDFLVFSCRAFVASKLLAGKTLTVDLVLQQYGLLLGVGTSFMYGLYVVMLNQKTDGGKPTN